MLKSPHSLVLLTSKKYSMSIRESQTGIYLAIISFDERGQVIRIVLVSGAENPSPSVETLRLPQHDINAQRDVDAYESGEEGGRAMASRNLNVRRGISDPGDVNDGAVFFVAILLLLLIAAVLFFGGNWLIPPTVPSAPF